MQCRTYALFLGTGLILQCLVLLQCNTVVLSITSSSPVASNELSMRHIGRALTNCLVMLQKWKCLEAQLAHFIDAAAQDNTTWRYNDFVIVEKRAASANNTGDTNNDNHKLVTATTAPSAPQHRPHFLPRPAQQRSLTSPDVDASLASKLLQLAKSRSIRLQLPAATASGTLRKVGAGISDAIDSLALPSFASIAPAADASADEGRKKKDKDKNMAMMGGMAMMAMVAQMFLGKVILIAGAAFVMAKIALLVSVLGSLKKGSTGSSGSSTEHVIVTSGGGGGGHGHDSGSSGWHRSMPHDEYPKLEVISEAPIHIVEAPASSHHSPPPQSMGHKHNYYNYEITEGEDDGGVGGPYERRRAAGFLRK